MSYIEKMKLNLDELKIHWQNKAIHEDISFYAFIVSLLPIPGVSQAGRIADRISSSNKLRLQFEGVLDELKKVNSRICGLDDEINKLNEIANTLKFNNKINSQLEHSISELTKELQQESEWVLDTDGWSYQQIINSFVIADTASVIAKNNSVNVLENTIIQSNKTYLHASDGSKNFFNQTKFNGKEGSIGMSNISTSGNLSVENSGISFYGNSAINFGENLVSGSCSICSHVIQIDRRQLIGCNSIQCPNCKSICTI